MLRILPIVILSILFLIRPIFAQSKKAQKLYDQGIEELKNRKWDDAMLSFKKAIEKSPEFIDAHYQLGILHKAYDRDMQGVKLHFGKILELDSNFKNPSIPRVLGEIYLPENTSNLTWGDADLQTLYITAASSIYKIKTKKKGYLSYIK